MGTKDESDCRLKIYHISTYSANFLAWREAVTLTFYSRIFFGP